VPDNTEYFIIPDMKKVIIIGAGGHGAEIDDYIATMNSLQKKNRIEIIGYIDDNPENYSSYQLSGPLLGDIRSHEIQKNCEYIIAIGKPDIRQQIVSSFVEKGAVFASLIHPTTMISASAVIGRGNVIAPMVNLGPNVKIGDFNLLNARLSIGHDSVLGNFNFVAPNVSLSGHTSVGNNNIFGINSATIPGITIGSSNKIAAGMVLDKNVGDQSTVFYRFREKVIAIPK